MFDSFVDRTAIIFRIDADVATFDDSLMIIDAVDVVQVIFMIDVDLFRNRFGNGLGSY
jgi:hypothetical protein